MTRKKKSSKKESPKNRSVSPFYKIVLIAILIAVIIPVATNFIYWQSTQEVIKEYEIQSSLSMEDKIATYFLKNSSYNEDLSARQDIILQDPYQNIPLLNNNIEGSIYLPKLSLHLPISTGSQEGAMQKAFSLLEGSSLLGGGNNTHSVLVDYRELVTNKWFYNLKYLQVGDRLYLSVLGQNFAYQINQIERVKVGELESLTIQPGHDYLSIITHTIDNKDERLLIRSHRIDYVPTIFESDQRINNSNNLYRLLFYLSSVVLLLLILYLIDSFITNRKNN